MGKKSDLSDFDRGVVVGARQAGWSVSETAELLGFSRTTASRVYTEWREKEKTSSERHSCGRKRLITKRGQRRLDRLVQTDRTASITEITMRYNSGAQKLISESTTRRTLKWMGYSKRPSPTLIRSGHFQDGPTPIHKAENLTEWILEKYML